MVKISVLCYEYEIYAGWWARDWLRKIQLRYFEILARDCE